MKVFLFCCLFCFFSISVFAQLHKQGNIWAFGYGAGIDFNSGSPIAIQTAIQVNEGCASVCDTGGQLLFYTDGSYIYNRNNTIMPNGILFTNGYTNSATQGALIVPMPGAPDKYYVFSLPSYDFALSTLYYSIVDMTLDNGLGDVIPAQKKIMLNEPVSERMTAVLGDHCDVWVVVHDRYINQYRSFDITSVGISAPVLSNCGSYANEPIGVIKASPDGHKLAAAVGGGELAEFNTSGIELYDFDPTTGMVSNVEGIDIGPILTTDPSYYYAGAYYGLCFSPDNSKLYASAYGCPDCIPYVPPAIYQFDVSLPTASAITASKIDVDTFLLSDLKLGPDNRIYYGTIDNANAVVDTLHAINFPNLAGMACQPVPNAVPSVYGTYIYLGLPNELIFIPPPDSVYTIASSKDTNICSSSFPFKLYGQASGTKYLWNTGDTTDSISVIDTGTYWVRSLECKYYTDTFKIKKIYVPSPVVTGPASYCQGQPFIPFTTGGSNLLWYTPADTVGSTATPVVNTSIAANDTFYVTQSANGCNSKPDTVTVTVNASTHAAFADSIIQGCTTDTVIFNNLSANALYFLWNFGDESTDTNANPVHVYTGGNTYTVTLIASDKCADTATATVITHNDNFQLQLSPGEEIVPLNTEITLQSNGNIPYHVLSWAPAWLFPDQTASSQTLTADSSRRYFVLAQSDEGCIDSASVFVYINTTIFLPSAFTPNGDGLNDYFRPRYSGDPVIVNFLHVYNRWGQLVFDGIGVIGEKGWDGTYNGQPVDIGVYFYTIQVQTSSGKIIDQKGDVTLIR